MDLYNETLVRRKFTPAEKNKIKTLFVTLLSSSVLFMLVIPYLVWSNGLAYLATVSLIVFAIILFIIWRTLKKMQLEFEYIITNDTLDIDKIVAQKKRIREISFEIKETEEIGKFTPQKFVNPTFDYIVRAEKYPLAPEGNYYIILHHAKYKRCLVVFTPDDKMLEALKRTLPPRLSREI